MNIDWGAASAVIASLLLFVVGAWKILEDRSALRRLERLVIIHGSIEEDAQAKRDLEVSIDHLAKKMLRRESPLSNWSFIRNAGFAIVAACFILMVLSIVTYDGIPQKGNPGFVLYSASTVLLIGGLLISYLAILFQIIGVFEDRFRQVLARDSKSSELDG